MLNHLDYTTNWLFVQVCDISYTQQVIVTKNDFGSAKSLQLLYFWNYIYIVDKNVAKGYVIPCISGAV
jgi:hypothetical protein